MMHSMLGRGMAAAGALALAATCAAAPATAAGQDIFMAPHRAIYEMTLVDHARRHRGDGGQRPHGL